jgi:hypothetical protein
VEIPKNQDIDYEKWLTIAKYIGANEWAKYADIQEFWSPGDEYKNPISTWIDILKPYYVLPYIGAHIPSFQQN